MDDNTLYAMTLFSGMGGSAQGLRNAGFKDKYFCDWLVPQVETLKLNFMDNDLTEKNFFCGDIRNLTGQMVLDATGLEPGRMDIMQASPPCQDFSPLNTGKYSDLGKWFSDRNYLFKATFNIAEVVQPKVIVYENVSAVIENDEIFFEILDQLKSIGYGRYEAFVLQSGYYESHQNRPRLWIVAYRNDVPDKDGNTTSKPTEPKILKDPPFVVKEVEPQIDYLYYPQFGGFIDEAAYKPMKTITKNPNFYVDNKDAGKMKRPIKENLEEEIKELDGRMFPFLYEDDSLTHEEKITQSPKERMKRIKDRKKLDVDDFLGQLDEIFDDPQKLNNVFDDWVKDSPEMAFSSWRRPTLEELLNLSDFPLDYKFPETVQVQTNQNIKALEKGKKPTGKLRAKKVGFNDKWNMIGNIVLPKQMEVIANHIKDELGWS